MKTLADVIPELEAMLAWAKENPTLPYPDRVLMEFVIIAGKKNLFADIARSLPKTTKGYNDTIFDMHHNFGPAVQVRAFALRDTVCTRRVVGTKEIPATVIPAKPEQVIPARVEEIYAWDCGSLLATDTALTASESH